MRTRSDRVLTRLRPRKAWLVVVGVLLLVVAVAGVLVVEAGATKGLAAAQPARTPSAGTAGPTPSADPVALVGFGDSVMYGAGCACDDFLAQAASRVQSQSGHRVGVVNNGANGETAAGVLHDLRLGRAAQREVTAADVIVLTVGANDLAPALDDWQACRTACYAPLVDRMATRLGTILEIINTIKRSGAVVLVTNYWNVFEDGDVGAGKHGDAYLDWSDGLTRAANAAICRAAIRAQAGCVDLYQPFKGDGGDDPTQLLAGDGDHPNEHGTALIAAAVADAIVRRLPS